MHSACLDGSMAPRPAQQTVMRPTASRSACSAAVLVQSGGAVSGRVGVATGGKTSNDNLPNTPAQGYPCNLKFTYGRRTPSLPLSPVITHRARPATHSPVITHQARSATRRAQHSSRVALTSAAGGDASSRPPPQGLRPGGPWDVSIERRIEANTPLLPPQNAG